MKHYNGTRITSTAALVHVMEFSSSGKGGILYPLKHYVRHSPDGFNWGYAGSGPAELARCMLIDFLEEERISGALYQDFKARVIARLPQEDDWTITDEQIGTYLRSPAVQAITTWLDDEQFPALTDDGESDGFDPQAWFDQQEAQNTAFKRRWTPLHTTV